MSGGAAISAAFPSIRLPDRIMAGYRAYIDSIEHPVGGVEMLKSRFVPGSLYTDYMTRDLNFEDFCYRSAVGKKCLHPYAHPDRFDVWFNMTFLPLEPDEGNLRFCTYTMEINPVADSSRMSNVSSELASSVLETAIKLCGATDFEAAMADVIKDIRKICLSQQCCILLMEPALRSCSVLCEDIAEGSTKRPVSEIIDDSFYDLAESWEATISGSNCLIIKNARDMLTGLLNRNEMNYYIDALSIGAQSLGKPVGVLFADLNGLKRTNDSLCHQTGDDLIRSATRGQLVSGFVVADRLFRWGTAFEV